MEKTHNQQYEELQEEYLKTRDNNILGKMYLVCRAAAKNYIQNYCKRKRLNLNISELSHNSATYCIEFYLRKPDFKIKRLSAYIYFAVIKCLFSTKNQDQEINYEAWFNEKEKGIFE